MLNHKTVFITGGTGSFGQKCIRLLLNRFPSIGRIVVYSRDELKQQQLQDSLFIYKNVSYIIGDVRDYEHLRLSMRGANVVIHTAALKQAPTGEFHPNEFIKTNILGSENVIKAALYEQPEHVVLLSTTKAVAPTNLYGATKLCAEKLFIAANYQYPSALSKFFVIRLGNLFGSRGSVAPLFLSLLNQQPLPVTDLSMTRFSITAAEVFDLLMFSLQTAKGGEVFIPQSPSYRVGDLVQALGENPVVNIIGLRPGEKLHEELIPITDRHFLQTVDKYIIQHPHRPNVPIHTASFDMPLPYASDKNNSFLTPEQLRTLIQSEILAETMR